MTDDTDDILREAEARVRSEHSVQLVMDSVATIMKCGKKSGISMWNLCIICGTLIWHALMVSNDV